MLAITNKMVLGLTNNLQLIAKSLQCLKQCFSLFQHTKYHLPRMHNNHTWLLWWHTHRAICFRVLLTVCHEFNWLHRWKPFATSVVFWVVMSKRRNMILLHKVDFVSVHLKARNVWTRLRRCCGCVAEIIRADNLAYTSDQKCAYNLSAINLLTKVLHLSSKVLVVPNEHYKITLTVFKMAVEWQPCYHNI